MNNLPIASLAPVVIVALVVAAGLGLIKHFTAGSPTAKLRRAKALVSRWGGLVIVLVGAVLWFAVPAISELFESKDAQAESAWMDWSVFQTLLLSGIRAVILYCFAVLMVRIYLPAVFRFWKRHFVRVFYRLTEWQKVIASLWAVSLFVYICVSLTH